jgi:hypothetical protein
VGIVRAIVAAIADSLLSFLSVGIVRAIVAAIADSLPPFLPCELYALSLRPLPVHTVCVRLARVIVRVIVAAVAVSLSSCFPAVELSL